MCALVRTHWVAFCESSFIKAYCHSPDGLQSHRINLLLHSANAHYITIIIITSFIIIIITSQSVILADNVIHALNVCANNGRFSLMISISTKSYVRLTGAKMETND